MRNITDDPEVPMALHSVSTGPETPPTGFILTAAVTIIDRTRIAVPTTSLSEATTLILRRRHRDTPIVELSPAHTQSNDDTPPTFEANRWYVTPNGLTPVPSDSTELTTYKLSFHDFSIISADTGATMPRTANLDAVIAAVQALANRHVHPLQLTSTLPGFITQTIDPQEFDNGDDEDDTDHPFDEADTPPASPLARLLSRFRKPRSSTPSNDPLTLFADPDSSDAETAEQLIIPPRPSTPPNTPTHNPPPTTNRWAWIRHPATQITIASLLLIAVVTAMVIIFFPREDPKPPLPTEVTVLDAATPIDTDTLVGFDTELWSIDSSKAAALSWFGAGVAYIDKKSGDLVLDDPGTGDTITTASLESPVKYTAEFLIGDTPAIAARTEKSVIALTADGKTHTWPISGDQTVSVTGTTPMVTTADGTVHALVFGEDKPVKVTTNPQYIPAAIDASTLYEFAADRPELVAIPFGSDADDPATITLPEPVEDAAFSRHLSIGHGYAVTLWTLHDTTVAAIHDLHDNGTVTATVEVPDTVESWQIGRGMTTAILGTYAIDLNTGTPTSRAETDFITALGPLAVTEPDSQRVYIRDGRASTSAHRIIGYTADDIAIIRTSDGTVTALKKGSNS